MTLEMHELIQRFLLHVLPGCFQRIRHYGWLGNRARQAIGSLPPTPRSSAITIAGAPPLADPHDRYHALTGRSLHVGPACSAGTTRHPETLPAMVGRSTRPVWADTS